MGKPPPGRPRTGLKRRMVEERPFPIENLGFFPELPHAESQIREEYVKISSLEPGRPMMSLNQYIVRREINRITKKWSKFSRTRQGDILLKIQGEEDIAKLKSTKKLGLWNVQITKDEFKNKVKGVVFSRDLCYLSDIEVKEALDGWCADNRNNLRVTEVFMPKRHQHNREGQQNVNNGNINTNSTNKQGGGNTNGQNEVSKDEPRPFGLAIVTFDALVLPRTIGYGFDSLEVRRYIPNPMRCRKCHGLGHTIKRCTGSQRCNRCGKVEVENHTCHGEFCINCNAEGHLASNRACQTYLVHKEYEEIQANSGCSRFEAKKHFHSIYPDVETFIKSKDFKVAQIVSGQTSRKEVSQETPKNQKGVGDVNKKNMTRVVTPPDTPNTLRLREEFMDKLRSDSPVLTANHEIDSPIPMEEENTKKTNDTNTIVIANIEMEEETETQLEISKDKENVSEEPNKNLNNSEQEDENTSQKVNLSNILNKIKEKKKKITTKRNRKNENKNECKSNKNSSSESAEDGTSD